MSILFLCCNGASVPWMREVWAVIGAKSESGWSIVPERESLGAQEVAMALRETGEPLALRRQMWTIQLKGKTVETMEVWDLPLEFYHLMFLDAAEDTEPATFERRLGEHRAEISVLFEAMAKIRCLGVVARKETLLPKAYGDRLRQAKVLAGVAKMLSSRSSSARPLLCLAEGDKLPTEEEARTTWMTNSFPSIPEAAGAFIVRTLTAEGVEELLQGALLGSAFAQACHAHVQEERKKVLLEANQLASLTPYDVLEAYKHLLSELPWPLTVELEEPHTEEAFQEAEVLLNAASMVKLDHPSLLAFVDALPEVHTRLGEELRKALQNAAIARINVFVDQEKSALYGKRLLVTLVVILGILCLAVMTYVFLPLFLS